MSWLGRLRNVIRSNLVSDDIDREMAFHLSERTDDLVASGMPRDAADREARRRFGNYAIQKENTRERDVFAWLDALRADARYALRGFRSAPGFAVVAILSLALGIGANTAIFTLVNVVMLKSLPVQQPDELVMLTLDGNPESKPSGFSEMVWRQVERHQTVFSGMFAYGSTGVDLASGGDVRLSAVGLVTGGFFSTLGVHAVLGRTLAAADDQPGCPGVAVITHAHWQSEFGGSADVVGKSLHVSGYPFRVVGVADPSFIGLEFGYHAPIWAPQCAGTILRGPGAYRPGGLVIGRLKPGVTLEQSRANLAALELGIVPSTKGQAGQTEIGVVSFSKGLAGLRTTYGGTLMILMAVVGVVLLIACANVANLLMARAAARQHEMAVRLAIGASRSRLIRQLLTESVILSLAGAALGALLAGWGSRFLVGFLSRRNRLMPLDLSPDMRVLMFTIAIGILTGVFFGLAPAWRAARVDQRQAMNPSARGGGQGRSQFRFAKALVVSQVALSLVMVAGAGLLVGSWRRLAALDPGFRSDGVLLVGVDTRAARVSEDRRVALYGRMLMRLRSIPGVASASTAEITPFGSSNTRVTIDVPGYDGRSANDAFVRANQVSGGYFSAMGTRILAGRDFDARDVPSSAPVAIVNEALGRKFFGRAAALGERIRVRNGRDVGDPIEIVGIVADTKESSVREESQPILYFPLAQDLRPGPDINFVLRAGGTPVVLAQPVRSALADIDPRLSLDLRTLQRQVDDSLRLPRTLGVLSGFFGGLALLLASVGLYGILSYMVARRRNEIGVRIALGAGQSRVVRMVFGEVGRMLLAGVAIGTILTLATTRLVTRYLYGVQPNDPMTLALSALALGAVAFGASTLPAWRAARLDPVAALRED